MLRNLKGKRVVSQTRAHRKQRRTKQEHDHVKQRNTGELGLVVEYEGGKNSNKSWKKRNASKYSANSAETRLPKKETESFLYSKG